MANKITIEIKTENSAFDNGAERVEVARILKKLSQDIQQFGIDSLKTNALFDINGNRVGYVHIGD